MALKHIELKRGYVLNIDARDIPLPCNQREAVWSWAEQQNIQLEGHKYGVEGWDVWRVRDDKQRALFLLRWQ